MKTILTLIAVALTSGAFAAEKCANCGACCKGKDKASCTKDCCKK